MLSTSLLRRTQTVVSLNPTAIYIPCSFCNMCCLFAEHSVIDAANIPCYWEWVVQYTQDVVLVGIKLASRRVERSVHHSSC